MRKINISKLIIGIVTGVLAFSFVIMMLIGFQEIRDYRYDSPYGTEEYYLSHLQRGEYGSLLDKAGYDTKLDRETSPEIELCRAVGHYYEAAVLCQAYEKAGKMELAQEQRERMGYYQEQMGEEDFWAEDIQEELGILNSNE